MVDNDRPVVGVPLETREALGDSFSPEWGPFTKWHSKWGPFDQVALETTPALFLWCASSQADQKWALIAVCGGRRPLLQWAEESLVGRCPHGQSCDLNTAHWLPYCRGQTHCLAGWTISREGWRPWINSMELTFFPIFLWRFPRGGVLVEPEGEYRALPRGTMCVNHVNHVNHINHVNHVCQPDLSLDSTDFHLIIPPLIKTYFQMIKGGDYLWMRSEWWARIIIQQKGCDGQFGLLPRRCVNLLLHSLCSVAQPRGGHYLVEQLANQPINWLVSLNQFLKEASPLFSSCSNHTLSQHNMAKHNTTPTRSKTQHNADPQ